MEPLQLSGLHPNRDFFVCDIFDALPYFKDDMASMEHPVFSLSTKPDMRVLHYEHNSNSITIKPSYDGLATIHDKDILLYCASYLRAAIANGHEPNQTIRFSIRDFFLSTNRGIDGRYYQNFKDALNRLRGTTINTNIRTGGKEITKIFGLIESAGIVKEDITGRVIAVEIKLSDWFYNAVIANELLTINRNYFQLRKPLERRIYELARKHCGDGQDFKISLFKLHKKIGTTAPIRKLRAQLRQLKESNHLPDYRLSLDADIVTFTSRRASAREGNVRLPLLSLETFEKAKQAAPGWDVYNLEDQWREWIAGKEKPKNPDAAFIAFCRNKYKRERKP